MAANTMSYTALINVLSSLRYPISNGWVAVTEPARCENTYLDTPNLIS